MAQDEPEDAAAEAFEALRAEVIQLRSGVESLSATFQGQVSADYTPTLGAIAKSLAAVEGHPALQITPETFAYRLREANELSAQQGRRELANAVQRVVTAGAGLENLATGWRTGREQVRQVVIMTAVGAVVGVVIWVCFSGPVARALPASWRAPERMAAATLGLDRWEAGGRLMESASPQGWVALADASDFAAANRKALEKCREAVRKTNQPQRCAFVVQPAPPAGENVETQR